MPHTTLNTHMHAYMQSGPKIIKLFFMLNSAEHEIFFLINLKLLTTAYSFLLNLAQHETFSANKYENAQLSWAWKKFYNLWARSLCQQILQSVSHRYRYGNSFCNRLRGLDIPDWFWLFFNPPPQSGLGIIEMAFVYPSVHLSIPLSFPNTFLSAPYLLNPLKDFH